MASMKLFSDEEMEPVFYHLDFPTKCRLRRCCRRWNYLLHSSTGLHTVVIPLPLKAALRSHKKLLKALNSVAHHLVHVVLIAANDSEADKWENAGSVITGLILMEKPNSPSSATASGHAERHLSFCNFNLDFVMLQKNPGSRASRSIFQQIELHNVKLAGSEVQTVLLEALRQDKLADSYDDFLPLVQADPVGLAGLTVQLACQVGMNPWDFAAASTVTTYESEGMLTEITKLNLSFYGRPLVTTWFALIRDQMRNLTQQERLDMLDRLHQYEESLVQAAFIWLMKTYEPNWNPLTEPSVWTFNFDLCSLLVGRVLACYEGKTVNDDYEVLEDEYDEDDDAAEDDDDMEGDTEEDWVDEEENGDLTWVLTDIKYEGEDGVENSDDEDEDDMDDKVDVMKS